MSYRSSIETYYNDLTNLIRLLDSYVINYRNLVSTLNDINLNVLISKRKKKQAIKQVEKLSCIIDMLLDTIEKSQICYFEYVKMKCSVLCEIINCDFIRLEVEQELLNGIDTDFKHKYLTFNSKYLENYDDCKSERYKKH